MSKPQIKVEAEYLKKLSLSILVSVILICLQTQWNYPTGPAMSWAPTRYDWMLWYFQYNIVSAVSQVIDGIIGAWFGLSFLNKQMEAIK